MKIRTKLLLALSTLPILLLLIIGTGVLQNSHLKSSSNTMRNSYELALHARQIHTNIKTEAMRLRNLVIFTDKQVIEDELAALELEREEIQRSISILESLSSKEEIEIIASLKMTNDEFNEYMDEVVTLVLDNRRTEAIALIDENSVELHEEFFGVISNINSILNERMELSLSDMLKNSQRDIVISITVVVIAMILIILLLFKNIWSLSSRLNKLSAIMSGVANGEKELDTKVEVISNDEIDQVANSFNQMTTSLAEQMNKEQELTWAKTNIADISTSITGTHDLETLGQIFLSKIVPLVNSAHGVFYVNSLNEEEKVYRLVSSYAFTERKHLKNIITSGEGLIGQSILEKKPIILTNVPSDYVTVSSGLGEAKPLNLYVMPIIFEGDVKAVLEMASFEPYTELHKSFLEELANDLGIILDSVMGRIRLAKLLEESQQLMEEIQAQSEELQQQQEELKAANEELEGQTIALRASEEKLQMQQEELEQINTELEEKAKSLEEQNKVFEETNREVEKAKQELELKAEQLAQSSKYKSEFLANMSHELRTPLNSLLILSKLLADNAEGNLTPKQLEYSKTIYSSGHDLLLLINDILELAKIESGKMVVNASKVEIGELVDFVEKSFKPVANEKNLEFLIHIEEDVPNAIYSDEVRIQQILKNLLSNAFKFTHQGEVRLEISVSSVENGKPEIAFSVIDTGIGISKDKQELIFEAFQQADGTTSRKYGGTGLGLSISKELATLLGGRITVDSKEGHGSAFAFFVSDFASPAGDELRSAANEVAVTIEAPRPVVVKEDNDNQEDKKIKRLLIVDDDKVHRNSLMEMIGDMDFIIKAVSSGEEALEQLKLNEFDCIVLDLSLGDTDGFQLLESINESGQFKNLKVIVYTGRDLTIKEEVQLNKFTHTIIIKNENAPKRLKDELSLFLEEQNHYQELENYDDEKIADDLKGKKILLVDDDVRNLFAISTILETNGFEVLFAHNGADSLEVLNRNTDIDLILMDIMMPEMDGFEAIRRIRKNPKLQHLPVIALTAKAMPGDREQCLAAGASDYIVKPIESTQLLSLIKVWLY